MTGTLNPILVNLFRDEFHSKCLQLVINAYFSAKSSKSVNTTLDEEDITAILSKFIEDNPSRLDWNIVTNTEERLRDDKIPETKGFAKKSARIDLRFTTINTRSEYKYHLEAKNLKSDNSALKRRYISTGIDNYISSKYQNGFLVGYLLKGDVTSNVKGVNDLLKKDSRNTEMINNSKLQLVGHDYYISDHTTIKINHLFFDFN